ncbi:MAG: hypothetical protein QOD53_897, partial [Thermoleophilaceae bacterium]|nr:hypothetical protein [Thermoleophilaceae bacterium]
MSDQRPVAFVLERYPELSQTFVDGEIRGLVAAGQPVRVLALAPGARGAEPPPVHFDYPARHGRPRRLAAAARVAIAEPRAAGRMLARERFWPPAGGRARGLA